MQQELSSTFARLCHLVDETTGEMKDDIKRIDAELAAMEENAARSKVSNWSLVGCVYKIPGCHDITNVKEN